MAIPTQKRRSCHNYKLFNNGIIAYNVRNQLSKLVDAPVHAMWNALHTQNNARKNNNRVSHLFNDVEQVNAFFTWPNITSVSAHTKVSTQIGT